MNSIRNELLTELNKCQAETIRYFESNTFEIDPKENDEQLYRKLFATSYCFLVALGNSIDSNESIDYAGDLIPNKLYLFVTDFYLNKEIETLFR